MTEYPCCCCGKSDAKTNTGGIFCHGCSDNASEEQKEVLFGAFVARMASLQHDLDKWERAA